MTRTIKDRFGHSIRVSEWPSKEGFAKLRTHYRDHHPEAFKGWPKGLKARKGRLPKGEKRMTKLAKKWITQAAKTVPSSQWRTRGLKKAWALQKAAKGKGTKGGGKKSPAKKAKKSNPRHLTNPGGGSTGSNKMRLGATYRAARGVQYLTAPLIEEGVREGPENAETRLRQAADRAFSTSYGGAGAVELADAFVSQRLNHEGSLSRGSLTALAPEAFALLEIGRVGVDTQRATGSTRTAITNASRKASGFRGYNTATRRLDLSRATNPDMWTYYGLKIGGGLLRKATTKIGPVKRVFAPVKKAISMISGGALHL